MDDESRDDPRALYQRSSLQDAPQPGAETTEAWDRRNLSTRVDSIFTYRSQTSVAVPLALADENE